MGIARISFAALFAAAALLQAADDYRSPEALASGQKLFAAACSACHGKTGEGGRGPNLADGTLVRRSSDQRLFGSIKNGIPGSDMPGFPIGDEKVWHVVGYLRSLSSPAIASPPPGDPEAGRAVFSAKGRCSTCHALRGEGGHIGPDLSNIGASRSVKQLREAVHEPSARIAEGFAGATLKLKSGATISGVLKNANNYSLQVLDSKGAMHLIDANSVANMEVSSTSLMPEVAKQLSPEELQNVIAFISRQAIRPAEASTPARTSERRRQ